MYGECSVVHIQQQHRATARKGGVNGCHCNKANETHALAKNRNYQPLILYSPSSRPQPQTHRLVLEGAEVVGVADRGAEQAGVGADVAGRHAAEGGHGDVA